MLFTSSAFIIFVVTLWLLYYMPRMRAYQLSLLIVAGLLFYISNSGWLSFVLIGSLLVNGYLSYKLIYGVDEKRRRVMVTAGVLTNVALLFFFKYGMLFSQSLNELTTGEAGPLFTLALPIGISFYTFEGISLLVDAHKKTPIKAYQPRTLYHHLKNTFLFVSFFPHLVAGPILRAGTFFPQINTKYIRDIDWEYCFKKLVAGYFLKLVVANNLYDFTLALQSPYMDSLSSLTLLLLLAGYLCQIFADFAGYTKIALGLAGLFGYRLEENFNYPFISKSLTEFWRRWHITLSSFLRHYVYTVWLGNGRRGKARALFNIVLTMMIGGFWHGAQWTFLLWGLLHGLALVIEHFMKKLIPIGNKTLRNFSGWLLTITFVVASTMLYKFDTLNDAHTYILSFFTNYGNPNDYRLITNIILYTSPVVAMHLLYILQKQFKNYNLPQAEYLLYGMMLFFIITNAGQATSFIYFKF